MIQDVCNAIYVFSFRGDDFMKDDLRTGGRTIGRLYHFTFFSLFLPFFFFLFFLQLSFLMFESFFFSWIFGLA